MTMRREFEQSGHFACCEGCGSIKQCLRFLKPRGLPSISTLKNAFPTPTGPRPEGQVDLCRECHERWLYGYREVFDG